jgi:nucleoside-diphosphate-sugar epimerase
MKIFVAGATGVIGRRLVPMLVGAGHQVVAMTRSELKERVVAAAPEVIVHELTDLPPNVDPRKMEEQLAGNDRIRSEGTRNLVSAALAAGARRIVAQSIAFAYAPVGGLVKSEEDPLFDDAGWPFSRSVEALHDLERAVTETEGIDGLVLRYGFFYGPGSSYAPGGYWAGEVKRRRFPIVGRGGGVFSYIHVDDAAAATVAAVERGSPGIYNVVDDEPAPLREWLPAYAEAIGAKKPFRIPKFIARLMAGSYTAGMATSLRGASNEKAKRELGWTPRYPSWRQGFREAIG